MQTINKTYHIVFESQDFVIVHKYPNVNFHTEENKPGVFESVRINEGFSTLYPVHRLDKITSGLLVMAKTSKANHELCRQFSDHSIEKYYLALSAQKPKKKQGTIKGDMKGARRGSWMLTRTQKKPAITQFFSMAKSSGQRLFIIKPHTGRTHQIRVALKSLGAAIMGDPLYASAEAKSYDRGYLHAYSLGFNLNGKFYRFTEKPNQGREFLAPEFSQALQQYSTPWELSWPKL